MIKILVPFFLVLFLSNAAAEGLDTLDRDLKLLKSNLLLLSDKIALSDDDLVVLGHIDVLTEAVKEKIGGLGSDRLQYESYLHDIEAARESAQWNRSDVEFNLDDLNEDANVKIKQWEYMVKEDWLNNKHYLYDSVACPNDYSLSEWRAVALSSRKLKAIRCTIRRKKDQIYSLYKKYIDEYQKVSGDVLINCSIGRDGVITINDSKSNLPPALVSGILNEFSNIEMPILDSGDTDLEYKFTFLPE